MKNTDKSWWRGIHHFCFILLLIAPSCQVNQGEHINDKPEDLPILSQVADSVEKIKEKPTAVHLDLKEIKKRGKLIALTGYSYTSYFIYKGSPMGYEYELLSILAKDLGVRLEIVPVKNMDDIFKKLNNGEGDIIADNLPVTKEWDQLVDFTIPCNVTRQVLVQRSAGNKRKVGSTKDHKALIRNPLDLIGKEVYVRKNSAFYHRLTNLSAEIGSDIKIMEVPGDLETEELIQKVSKGEIDYTVADEQMAMFNKSYYSNIDIETAISFPQNVAWAVRETSPQLKDAINKWIVKMKKNPTWYTLYNKYFKSRKTVDEMVNCSRVATCAGKISPYDELIIKAAKNLGWDWRLLTSLIYQESRFNPMARSWAGAQGLMQLMPLTATNFGVTKPEDPAESIQGGVKYLKFLDTYWKTKVPDKKERIKFILASYNIGQEHVADAQRLAKRYGKNPQKWDENVAYFMAMKAKEKYSSDPVVKFGYCRGEMPVHYVEEVMERYKHYKSLIKHEIYGAKINNDLVHN